MSDLLDENTRLAARTAADRITSFLTYFENPDATWEGFGKANIFVEQIGLDLTMLSHAVQGRLQEINQVEPIELGT